MFAMPMGLNTISPQELHECMRTGPLMIVDVNARRSWLTARVPGAISLSVDVDTGTLPQDRTARLIFYCSNPLCRKALSAAKRARTLGYTDIRVMSAGITGWTDARLPVESCA